MFKVVKEFIERYLSISIPIELHAHLEKILNLLSLIERGKFEYEVADFNSLCILICDVFEYVEYVLARRAYDVLEDLLQEGYRFPDSLGYLIVLVPELNFLEDRERDRIDEDNATINARGVYDQYLLVMV